MGEPTTLWVAFFILDFSSAWFRVYSIYLAGHRTDKVSNSIENLILPIFQNFLGGTIVKTLTDLWIGATMCIYT
jgi:hypothetical protein